MEVEARLEHREDDAATGLEESDHGVQQLPECRHVQQRQDEQDQDLLLLRP